MKRFILALDQGTTSSRALIIDGEGRVVAAAQKEFQQIYPQAGWVEHDPEEIWETQLWAAKEVLEQTGVKVEDIAGIGIANQRETVIAWDRTDGKPLTHAIVWQCRRTAPMCEELKSKGLGDTVREKTGLVIDPYFSATKIRWILDHVPDAGRWAQQGDLAVGTVDSWLIWKLTGGKNHVTDVTNASRTMLYNIHTHQWDDDLLRELAIPKHILPEVKNSSGMFGLTEASLFGKEIPILGVAGDQQAALFGQACFRPGMAKATYGTGAFLLMQTGESPVYSKHGLLTTIAWGLDDKVEYALEGSVFVAGALVQWLRDEMGLIATAAETEGLAQEVLDSGGVYVVPAFVGLGAPYWDERARGAVVGLTRGSGRKHVVRASLEAIAYQVKDVFSVMEDDAGIPLTELRVDGGASENDFLMQFQADIMAASLTRPRSVETTAQGAAFLAGLASGVWNDQDDIAARWHKDRSFEPQMDDDRRNELYEGWKRAVRRVRSS